MVDKDVISFTVQGDAVPKQSFRYRSGKGRSYQPARVKAWAEAVGWAARQAYQGAPLTGLLRLEVEFCLTHRRDVNGDNLVKCVADAMQGIIYVNDKQITDHRIIRRQGWPEGLLRVQIEEIENPEDYWRADKARTKHKERGSNG